MQQDGSASGDVRPAIMTGRARVFCISEVLLKAGRGASHVESSVHEQWTKIGLASDPLGGRLESKSDTKAAETRAKVAKAEAEAEVKKVATTHEAGWEKTMAQGSQNSFKDEWLVGLFSIPLILPFSGELGRTIVAEGFAALETMPDWYQYTLGVIVAASFGVRSATKFFGKK